MPATIWLVILGIFGVIGFALLGFVQAQLSEGRRFREQASSRKRVIACVSLAQWPYMFMAVYAAIALVAAPAPSSADQSASAYAGQESREIKALASEEIEGLLAGKGLGLAKAAELNRYPGPAHVLELAQQLQLTDAQLQSTQAIRASMEERARSLGARLVAAEAALERLFRAETADEDNLEAVLELIGELQAELRGVHLIAHVQQRSILSAEQLARYVHLRGYHRRHQGASGHRH